MTLFADKLKTAGFDTFEAQFKSRAVEAARKYPHSTVEAWRYLGVIFGHEFMRGIINDMAPKGKAEKSPPTPMSKAPVGIAVGTPTPTLTMRPYQPRKKLDPQQLEKAKVKLVKILFNYKISDGRDLGEVRAHEIDRFVRDGSLMAEIKKELPVLTGNLRFANLNELITVEQFQAARERAQI